MNDFDIDFSNYGEDKEATDYRSQLDEYTQLWEQLVEELIKVKKELSPLRHQAILDSKIGVEIKGKIYKTSNKEEREALIAVKYPELTSLEEELQEKVHFYEKASSNVRQCLSSMQSKMRQSGTVIEAMSKNQI